MQALTSLLPPQPPHHLLNDDYTMSSLTVDRTSIPPLSWLSEMLAEKSHQVELCPAMENGIWDMVGLHPHTPGDEVV